MHQLDDIHQPPSAHHRPRSHRPTPRFDRPAVLSTRSPRGPVCGPAGQTGARRQWALSCLRMRARTLRCRQTDRESEEFRKPGPESVSAMRPAKRGERGQSPPRISGISASGLPAALAPPDLAVRVDELLRDLAAREGSYVKFSSLAARWRAVTDCRQGFRCAARCARPCRAILDCAAAAHGHAARRDWSASWVSRSRIIRR
jgi:hypothetical protein